jgi:hypothetical protein
MFKTRFLVMVCASVLALGACNKKDADQAPADKAAGADKMAGDKGAAGASMDKAGAAADKAAPPAAGGAISSPADYEAKSNDMMGKMSAMLAADGKDCDKLAADMIKFFTDNKAGMDATDAFEKANPDAKKAYDTKTKAQQDDIGAKITAASDACKDNAAFKDALSKVPG